MENLEENSSETRNATASESAIEIIAAAAAAATVDAAGPANQPENLDDSVEIIENPVEVLDLTSPQPSTSSSHSAGAVGPTNLVKLNLEETLKKETNADQNPSTSASANTTSSTTAPASGSSGGNVLECPICLQTCIHPARLPCGHIFCFLCVKGVAYKNRRCAMCRREIPPEFLDHPQLVNGIEDICTTKATDDGYQWFYEGRNGGWWAYEKRNAYELEAAFQKFSPQLSYHQMLLNIFKRQTKERKKAFRRLNGNNLPDADNEEEDGGSASEEEEEEIEDDPSIYQMQICGSTYIVDFQSMTQYPQDMPYRKRKICRAKGLPAKGVAGWWQYDDRTSQDLEEAFKKGERSCTILVAGYVYIVDFDAMVQQRQNEPARCRRVKRDLATIPKKGVAGLRIEGNTVTTDSNFAAQVYQSRQNRFRSGELLIDSDLDSPDNPILRTSDPASPNAPGHLRLSYGGLGGYVIELGNPSEFVSTAAATDAALRIASDIIGSTLAHADELTRSGGHNAPSTSAHHLYRPQHPTTASHPDAATLTSAAGESSSNDLTRSTHLTTTSSPHTSANTIVGVSAGSAGGVNLSRERGSRELLGAAEDLLGATQRVIATADQPTIDLFEQTLSDFHALTLRNIVDSSDDDNDDNEHEHQQHTTPTGQRSSSSSHSFNQGNP